MLNYKTLQKLAEHGRGTAYKAQDTQLDRKVAVEFPPKHRSREEEAKRRFLQEAKVTSVLDHANVNHHL